MIVCKTCLTLLLIGSCIGCHSKPTVTTWNRWSGVFTWPGGEVTLPLGLKYWADKGDTLAGRFTSGDGKLIVRHDIGGYAGAYANMRGTEVFEERIVNDARVWTGRKKWTRGGTMLFAVTFPDNGCANFYVESTDLKNAAIIDQIARSFRPKFRSPRAPLCGQP